MDADGAIVPPTISSVECTYGGNQRALKAGTIVWFSKHDECLFFDLTESNVVPGDFDSATGFPIANETVLHKGHSMHHVPIIVSGTAEIRVRVMEQLFAGGVGWLEINGNEDKIHYELYARPGTSTRMAVGRLVHNEMPAPGSERLVTISARPIFMGDQNAPVARVEEALGGEEPFVGSSEFSFSPSGQFSRESFSKERQRRLNEFLAEEDPQYS